MSKELQALNERIAEKVGAELVDLIPADQWQAIVDAQIREFREKTAPKIISELFEQKFRDFAKARVDELSLTGDWDHITSQYTNDKLIEFLGKSGGAIFAHVLEPAMRDVLYRLRHELGYGQ